VFRKVLHVLDFPEKAFRKILHLLDFREKQLSKFVYDWPWVIFYVTSCHLLPLTVYLKGAVEIYICTTWYGLSVFGFNFLCEIPLSSNT
jgi:hypothetical protein